jgi:hypothetical protein
LLEITPIGDAVRNYEYIQHLSEETRRSKADEQAWSTHFTNRPSSRTSAPYSRFRAFPYETGSNDRIRTWIRDKLAIYLTGSSLGRWVEQNGLFLSLTIDHLARFFVAMVGGTFLLVPASLILLRRESIRDRLITLLVSVVVLSIFVSLTARPSNTEILAAVAAYTGVLVAVIGSYPAA